jgi:retron-type reverse transcriptase
MRALSGRGRFHASELFQKIISLENLYAAWIEFRKGKSNRCDVLKFEFSLEDNLFSLNRDLAIGRYRHGKYYAFTVADPKPRNIYKASVRDRVLHHAVYRILYLFFDRIFISDSYSCRISKGTHKALQRFTEFSRKVSCNNTKTIWVLKCDIRKFFASIDQAVLLELLSKFISDSNTIQLLQEIVGSFNSGMPGRGLPLGNLTSQLLVNIYMNEFDQFVKHRLKAKYYVRYADDFVILSQDRKTLECLLFQIDEFLLTRLRLNLHPDKVSITTFASGVDFLGWVHFPSHRVMRSVTRKRMMRRIAEHPTSETITSYCGMLGWGNGEKLSRKISWYTPSLCIKGGGILRTRYGHTKRGIQ